MSILLLFDQYQYVWPIRMDAEDKSLRRELFQYLARHNVLTLSYLDQNEPAACAVWYAVTDDLRLYFVSTTRTRHGAALQAGGKVAFTVQKDDQDWRAIQGVQGKGYCALIPPEQRDGAWETYSMRFPFVLQPFGSMAQALSVVTLWSITPDWLRLIDNTKGFGHKEELAIDNTRNTNP